MNNEFPQFDPSQVAPSTGGGGQSLPVSDKKMGHLVAITDHEIVQTKAGDGQWYLQLTLTIQDGPHAQETGVHRLNMGNADETAVRIAYQELSAICHVVGFLQPLNSADALMNKPFRVIVDYQKGADAKEKGYTNIIGFRDVNGNKPGEAGKAGGGPAPAPAPAPSPPPAPPMAQGPPPVAQQPQAPPPAPAAANTGFPPPQPAQQPQAQQQPQQPQYQQPGPPQQPQQMPQQQQPGFAPPQQPQVQDVPMQPQQQPQQQQPQQQVPTPPWGAPPQ